MNQHLVLRVVTKLMVGFIILFALYVQFHGDYSPGGGFQAGVILQPLSYYTGLFWAWKMYRQFYLHGLHTK